MTQHEALPNGPAAAAVVASGIGSLALGAFTTVADAIVPLEEALNFYNPTGPLSGKTTMAVVVWLVAWVTAHGLWRNKQVDFGRAFVATLIMITLGLVGTFPPFFRLFGH